MPTRDFRVYTSAKGEEIRLYMSDRSMAHHLNMGDIPTSPPQDEAVPLFYAKVRIPRTRTSMIDVRFNVVSDADGQLQFEIAKPRPRFTRIDKVERAFGSNDSMMDEQIDAELDNPEKDFDAPKNAAAEVAHPPQAFYTQIEKDIPVHLAENALQLLQKFRDREPDQDGHPTYNLATAAHEMMLHLASPETTAAPTHENQHRTEEPVKGGGKPWKQSVVRLSRGHHTDRLVDEAMRDNGGRNTEPSGIISGNYR